MKVDDCALFISDLHLSADTPRCLQRFLVFLEQQAPRAQALYILGDLFEFWAGDDDWEEPVHRQIVQALKQLSEAGVALYMMRGNRDLLMGQSLMQHCGAQLLPDPVVLTAGEQRLLLTHGDQLCTDDLEYQSFRAKVHEPEFQRQFLQQPLVQRKQYIRQLRQQSQQHSQTKDPAIMDVNEQTVLQWFAQHRCRIMIHGHTHRQNTHYYQCDDTLQRWVLGDWHADTSMLLRLTLTHCGQIQLEPEYW